MSQTNELLNSLTDEEIAAYSSGYVNAPVVTINDDRTISVPDELKRIAIQYDHHINIITFACPRHWGEIDMSGKNIYINYICPDGKFGTDLATDIEVASDVIYFRWTVSNYVTQVAGSLQVTVCIKETDTNGVEYSHWNSEINRDFYVSIGLKCTDDIPQEYPDVIDKIVTDISKMNRELFETREFGWLDYDITMDNDSLNLLTTVTDNTVSISGTEQPIIIHCAGEMLGFTFKISGWSDAKISFNGKTHTYVNKTSDGNTFSDEIVIPVTFMDTDIEISGGMNTWEFTEMTKRSVRGVGDIKDILEYLNDVADELIGGGV